MKLNLSILLLFVTSIAAHSQLVQAKFSEPDFSKNCDKINSVIYQNSHKELVYFSDNFNIIEEKSDALHLKFSLSSISNENSLLFVGVNHVNKPSQDLYNFLEDTVLQQKPDEIYLEVSDVAYLNSLPFDKETVINTRGEPSYLAYIAREHSIAVLPIEPDPKTVYLNLRKKFTGGEIGLAFVLRDIQILRDRRGLFGEDLERAAVESIESQQSVAKSAGERFSITNILDLTLAVDKLWPGLDWRRVPAQWANPTITSQETGSKFTNSVFATAMAARDEYALKLLHPKVSSGKRVLVLLGRTHVETHLKNLRCAKRPE